MTNGQKIYTLRQRWGALLLDLPRFVWTVIRPRWMGGDWVMFCNRADRLVLNPEGKGARCDWEFTRKIHLCQVYPSTARGLLRRSLQEWPIHLQDSPHSIADGMACNQAEVSSPPAVSFIIGHRGISRLPHLLLTLRSIAAQQDVTFECIVVEQDVHPLVKAELPDWVRYVHTPYSDPSMPYCRSWAFNVAARMARAPLLIFHDNDMLVPVRYAANAVRVFESGFEVVNLKRFVFYLARTDEDIGRLLSAGGLLNVDHVIENLEAGGSVAVSREAYASIGGFDEEFIGWGGEDNEFWDRCLTRKVWPYAFLPVLHVWHDAQVGKRAVMGLGSHTADLTNRRRAIDPRDRVIELHGRQHGRLSWTEN